MDRNEAIRGPINAVAPKNASYSAIAHTLARVMHRPCWIPVPQFAMKILLGQRSDLVLGSVCVEPELAVRTGYQFQHPSLEDALRSCVADSPFARALGSRSEA